MSELFRKLNIGKHPLIQVLNAPKSFEPELKALKGVSVQRNAKGKTGFALAFAITRKELDAFSRQMIASADEDALIWVAYPKGSSKRYACEFNRDSGWEVLSDAGYEPVRMVAIDEDWSVLRFRKVEKIAKLTRARALSKAGQARLATQAPKQKEKTEPKEKNPARRSAFASHEEYFAAQSKEAQVLLKWVQQTTEKNVAGASRCISYGMPAFRLKKMFLYFAAFKQHIGIYPPIRFDLDLIEDLKPYRGPKGNLSFPFAQPLPKALVTRVIAALAKEHGG
jgi:uncharacterized protein YdhG (YjbR/CyaY superfamily)